MNNVAPQVLEAWYIHLTSTGYPVFRADGVPVEETSYILLRIESDSRRANQHRFFTRPVMITEVVARFPGAGAIDDTVALAIDNTIGVFVYATPDKHSLPAIAGIKIVKVESQDKQYLTEDDGTFKYHRIITRHVHTVEQT